MTVSYLVFSPIKANFLSFGNILQVPKTTGIYRDLSQHKPDVPLKVYGITGIKTDGNLLSFDLQIDQNFILKMTSP